MPGSEGSDSRGIAAEAIRAAETALARQNSVTAQVDLAVVTAVLNAHTTHTDGAAALEALQHEIESAVATRTALDTPAGAREFQRYLIDKLGDIRAVVEDTDLDDTSKAALAAALASLYASAGSGGSPGDATEPPVSPAPLPNPASPPVPPPVPGVDPGLTDFGPLDFPGPDLPPIPEGVGPEPVLPATPPSTGQPPPAAPMVPQVPALPSLGGGPAGPSPLDGLNSLPALAALTDPLEPAAPLGEEAGDDGDGVDQESGDDAVDGTDSAAEPEPGAAGPPADRDETDQPFAEVIAAAVSGEPIADAFGRQGITVPAPGTPVGAPLAMEDVIPGDVALFDDRHALALGNGKVLLDDQIQPIETVNRPGFLGWQHPPEPDATAETDR